MTRQDDAETGERLQPVYIGLTISKGIHESCRADFDSNSVAARVNVGTFEKCWMDVFYNENCGLEQRFQFPKSDSESIRGTYFVWAITRKPMTPWGEVFYDEGIIITRSYIGLITEKFLKDRLPKTAEDLSLQRIHFGIDNKV